MLARHGRSNDARHGRSTMSKPHNDSRLALKQLVFKRHVALGLQADTGTEDIGQGSALLGQGVDDRGAGRGQWGLEHVAEDAEDAVEVGKLGRGGGVAVGLGAPLDARHHLANEDEIDDEGRGQERVLADIEQARQVS